MYRSIKDAVPVSGITVAVPHRSAHLGQFSVLRPALHMVAHAGDTAPSCPISDVSVNKAG